MLEFQTSAEVSNSIEIVFLEKYVISEGAVTHHVLYYQQQLTIARTSKLLC